jgi:hypothetical protein
VDDEAPGNFLGFPGRRQAARHDTSIQRRALVAIGSPSSQPSSGHLRRSASTWTSSWPATGPGTWTGMWVGSGRRRGRRGAGSTRGSSGRMDIDEAPRHGRRRLTREEGGPTVWYRSHGSSGSQGNGRQAMAYPPQPPPGLSATTTCRSRVRVGCGWGPAMRPRREWRVRYAPNSG